MNELMNYYCDSMNASVTVPISYAAAQHQEVLKAAAAEQDYGSSDNPNVA